MGQVGDAEGEGGRHVGLLAEFGEEVGLVVFADLGFEDGFFGVEGGGGKHLVFVYILWEGKCGYRISRT